MAEQSSYYTKHSETLIEQYNSLLFEKVHKHWLDKIPNEGMALDVGAESGRDARYLSAQGMSAVWMHIPPSKRERSFRKLSSLLKPNGKIVMSLRHGVHDDERLMYAVNVDELAALASQFGLAYKLALLRSLLRNAEGHPGAVIEQTDDSVILPVGLVSLYWLKLHHPTQQRREAI